MKPLKSEPAAIAGAIEAILALVIAFGIKLSVDQVGAIMAVVTAVLAVLVRQSVTPTKGP